MGDAVLGPMLDGVGVERTCRVARAEGTLPYASGGRGQRGPWLLNLYWRDGKPPRRCTFRQDVGTDPVRRWRKPGSLVAALVWAVLWDEAGLGAQPTTQGVVCVLCTEMVLAPFTLT